MTDDEPAGLKTTATSIAVLELLEEHEGARVSELAELMGKPKSTIHGHLATLKRKQFVVQEGDFYSLGPELLRLGSKVRTRDTGYVLARTFTERLFEETGLRSIFAVEMGGRAVFLHTVSGEKIGWAHEQLGNRLYLHNTAVGKAILAELPDRRVEQVVERWGLPGETENSITDREALAAELSEIRDRGYAVNRAENFDELYGIGVAATRSPGDVVGGFSVTGPAHAVTDSDREIELARTVTDAVAEFELELSLA
ncbi:IclR family transcriptional regulator [Halogeometricum sp. S1BR25-6]|uniref:IclR family transcriptional regulator n=1 Tax=Halogeometricum salsisoli TaxID=2950536 RepID=A0ABU2GIC5_9EURY|nr:IclR family transcriptional regulator [Halogeometricum sp. S1BR25-6]MDS0300581.1 IclR family transcriptional regulator [Halogeometricum sp. S1BR25-6]